MRQAAPEMKGYSVQFQNWSISEVS
jgi:hypothetical protein